MGERVTVYTRCSTRRGQLRRWWNYRIVRWRYETCDRCGRGFPESWWSADDLLFHQAHGAATGGMLGGLLCPGCFDRFAPVRIAWVAVAHSRLGEFLAGESINGE